MARQATESRIARNLVERYGRLPDEEDTRHGSEGVAKTCRCPVCRRAFPDAKKRKRMSEAARKTSSCRSGAKGHARCPGWKFPAGVNTREGNYRGATPCQCRCHEDGRGRVIPPLDQHIEEIEANVAEHRRHVAEQDAARG